MATEHESTAVHEFNDPVLWLILLALILIPLFGLYGPIPKDPELLRRRQVYEQSQRFQQER